MTEQQPDPALGCLGLLLRGIVGLTLSTFALLTFYGVVLLIFRHAFGLELPNPIDYLPADWREQLPRSR